MEIYLLNVFDNEVLHLIAETAVIVIGSILMGILLAYMYWGSYRKKSHHLQNKLDFERNQVADLNQQLNQISSIRDHLVNELTEERNKQNSAAKSIYEQNLQIYKYESRLR